MKNEDLETIIKIIDMDYRNSNVKDLKKVRDILNEKIKDLTSIVAVDMLIEPNELDDATFETNIDILLQKFYNFCKQNIVDVNKRKGFKANALHQVFKYILNERDEETGLLALGEVQIYKTLGMDKKQIMEYRNIGSKTLDIYESILNKYGLSMNKKLTESQLARLEEIKKEREIVTKKL